MSGARRICGILSAVCLSGLLGGCLVVPYPIPPLGYTQWSRHNLTDQVPAFISEEKTTRAEVLFSLGEPDASLADGTFVYTSVNRRGGVGATLLVEYAHDIPAANAQRAAYRLLTIRFDANGVVSSARMDLKTCWLKSSAPDIPGHFEHSSSCLPPGDSNTPEGTRESAAHQSDLETARALQAAQAQAAQRLLPPDEHLDQVLSNAMWFGETQSVWARARKQTGGEAPDGEIVVTDKSFLFASNADKAAVNPEGRQVTVQIPYAELEAVEVGTFGLNKWVMIRTKDGREQFFSIRGASSTQVDRTLTQAAADLLRAKIVPAAH